MQTKSSYLHEKQHNHDSLSFIEKKTTLAFFKFQMTKTFVKQNRSSFKIQLVPINFYERCYKEEIKSD